MSSYEYSAAMFVYHSEASEELRGTKIKYF